MRSMALVHRWSTHPDIHDKPDLWQPRFGYGWRTMEGPLGTLATMIAAGAPFIAAEMSSGHRTAAAFKAATLVAVDIDHGLTLEEFEEHPLAASACLWYTTSSHDPEAGAHRFRVVFQLHEPITDGELYKAVVTILTNALGGDRSCTDPTRLFYGNSKTRMVTHTDRFLSEAILVDAQRYLEDQRAACRDAGSENDEGSILRAIHVLEQVIAPTKDGERERFIRVSAAARAGGDQLFPAWSDWASRGHHGSGSRKHQSSERFFRGLNGSSLGTLFYLASEDDPDWRKNLPEELRNYESSRGRSATYAGYGHEDFMGDPEVTLSTDPIASVFDPTAPWAQRAKPAASGYDDADFDGGDAPAAPSTGGKGGGGGGGGGKGGRGGKGGPTIEDAMARLRNLYPGIRRNVVTDQIEFGPADTPQLLPDASTTYIRISRGSDTMYPKAMVNDLIQVIAYERSYNPVKAYLDNCLSATAPCSYFDRLGSELLGLDDDRLESPLLEDGQALADLILRRFLIGAVARTLDPGCEMSWMPILVGPQNCGKTAFFRYLTPPQRGRSWTTTLQQGITHVKDKPHILHAGWIVVLDEVERYFQRQYVEELKNLISVSTDYSAKKYQNEMAYRRAFVLAGATNNRDFLQDPTGNRRFMPIIVRGKIAKHARAAGTRIIDLDRLKADRDAIWSAAFQAYLEGEPWQFSSEELALIEQFLLSFTQDSPLSVDVARVLDRETDGYHMGRRYVTLHRVMSAMHIDTANFPRLSREVADEMKRLGWVLKRISIGGRAVRAWLAPEVAQTAGSWDRALELTR